jgi:hypothetical protein
MTDEEQRVIDCARRVVAAGRAWCDARDAAATMHGRGMQLRLLASLTEYSAAAENAKAELALMDAIDTLDAVEAGR